MLTLQVQLGTVGFAGVGLGRGPVARRSPLVLVAVTEPGGAGPFMLTGSVHVGFG